MSRAYKAEVDVFCSVRECLDENADYDLLLLDLDLESPSGLDIAIQTRKRNSNLKIAVLSSIESYNSDVFQIDPCGLLIKPIEDRQIIDMLEGFFFKRDSGEEIFQYNYRKMKKRIPYNNILYFVSNNKHVEIHTADGKTEKFIGKLSDICDSFPIHFIRVSKSYIVNAKHIQKYGKKSLILYNEEVINISAPHRNTFTELIAGMFT